MYNNEEHETRPNHYFIFSALAGLSIMIVAFLYPKYCEERAVEHPHENHGHHEHHEHHSFGEKVQICVKILSFYRMKKIIGYLFVVCLTSFNYEVFLTYLNEEQFHIKPFFEGSMDTVSLFFGSLWVLLYATKLHRVHNKWFCLAAILFRVISSFLMTFQVRSGIGPLTARLLLAGNTVMFNSVTRAFITLPATMAFAKCTPHSVEAMMMGLLGSIIKMNTEVIARMLGLLTLSRKEVSIENYEGMSDAFVYKMFFAFLGLFSLKFIFSRNEFMDLQQTLAKIATMDRK